MVIDQVNRILVINLVSTKSSFKSGSTDEVFALYILGNPAKVKDQTTTLLARLDG